MKNQSTTNQTKKSSLEKNKHSLEFKKRFLLEFTKQLIINSAPQEVLKLKEILDEKRKQQIEENPRKKKIEEIKEKYEKSRIPKQRKENPFVKRKSFPFQGLSNAKLRIPESKFPERLRYIKPLPMKTEIDLKELNPLIRDPFVETIECYGPNQNLIVIGKMGTKKTKITLSQMEIQDIVKKVSEATKIPLHEGIFKVAVGRLIFMAIISEIIGSKFIIKKMMYTPKRIVQ